MTCNLYAQTSRTFNRSELRDETSDRASLVRVTKAYKVSMKPLLSVLPLQVMDKYLEPLVLRAGTSAAVEVPFVGSPQPKATWWLGAGQLLRDSRRIRVETIHNLTTLVISRAERSDAGTYTLSLENQFGTSNLTVQVIVLGRCSLPVSHGRSTCTRIIQVVNYLTPYHSDERAHGMPFIPD
jgi:Immunoglobulin I-set domain